MDRGLIIQTEICRKERESTTVNDIYNYIRGVIQNALEENEDFPRMWELKRMVKREFGYKISTQEVMDCLGY